MHINRKFLAVVRTVHIYLTMFGVMVLLLFSVTGFMLNHDSWFGLNEPRTAEVKGTVPPAIAASGDPLKIVEGVRSGLKVTAALSSYSDQDDVYALAFRSPSEAWDLEVKKSDGEVTGHLETSNTAAMLTNLHRGKYTGDGWKLIIDLVAIVIFIATATGIILWLVLPKRRKAGIAALLVGAALMATIYFSLVPGADVEAHRPKPTAVEAK